MRTTLLLLLLIVMGCASQTHVKSEPARHKIMKLIPHPGGGVMNAWGLIDEQGRVVVEPHYYEIGPFRDGMAQVKLDDMKTIAFIDINGMVLFTLPKEVTDVGPFSEGLALANVGGKRDEIDGMALKGGKWGYIDKTGRWVIQPQFKLRYTSDYLNDQAEVYTRYLLDSGRFRNGRAAAPVEGGWGFIDRTGKIVIPGPYTQVAGFYAGHAHVVNEHSERISPNSTKQVITLDAVINVDGEIIWQTDWSPWN